MPSSVAQETPAVTVSTKKRRRDDHVPSAFNNGAHFADHDTFNGILAEKTAAAAAHSHGGLFHSQHFGPQPARKIVPLPSTKRQRVVSDERDCENATRLSHRHDRQDHPSHGTRVSPPRTNSFGVNPAGLMNRCHICSRKPTRKADLDSFADCQGCNQRTCFICIRECLGWPPSLPVHGRLGETGLREQSGGGGVELDPPPSSDSSFTMQDANDTSGSGMENGEGDQQQQQQQQQQQRRTQTQRRNYIPPLGNCPLPREPDDWARGGHRQMVCSRCCVEKGQDGDVVCLGCLPFVEG